MTLPQKELRRQLDKGKAHRFSPDRLTDTKNGPKQSTSLFVTGAERNFK